MQQPFHSKTAVFAIIVAILWVPFLIASLFFVNHVIGWYAVGILLLLGILLPTLASMYCQCKYLPRRGNTISENETRSISTEMLWSQYANKATQYFLCIALIAFCLSFNLDKPLSLIVYVGGIIAFVAVITLNFSNSFVILIRRYAYKNRMSLEGMQPTLLWSWIALMFSIDAIALTAYLAFIVWQLSLL